MNITLYNMTSDKNVLDKTITSVSSVTGDIKDESNIINPQIIMSSTVDSSFNYFYISDFGRYYYVTDKTVEHGRTIIHGHVDVLMSFNSAIKDLYVIAERASKGYDLYQIDNELPIRNYKVVSTDVFPQGFTSKSYLLATFGG